MTRSIAWLSGVLLFAVGLAGCASTPVPPGDAVKGELSDAPEWVRKGCSGYWEKKKERRLCGVGAMGSTRNAALARSAAIERARVELARSLQVQVEAMLKDYQASTTGGAGFGSEASDEQHVVDVSRQITEMSLSGTELVDSWISPSGTFYALVALDAEGFKGMVAEMKTLSEQVRAAVIERADRAFEDLDRQLDRRRD